MTLKTRSEHYEVQVQPEGEDEPIMVLSTNDKDEALRQRDILIETDVQDDKPEDSIGNPHKDFFVVRVVTKVERVSGKAPNTNKPAEDADVPDHGA